MSSSDVKRLLKKGKLSGREAARLIIQDLWAEQQEGEGFLSDTEKATIRANVQPAQLETYNGLIRLYDMASYAIVDAGRLGLLIGALCESLGLPVSTYATERRLRAARERLPHVVTAKQYEQMRLAQRDEKLARPVALNDAIEWYAPDAELASQELRELVGRYHEQDDPIAYASPFDFAVLEAKRPDLASPYLLWLLNHLTTGSLQLIRYSEEAAEAAHGYFSDFAGYAIIYEHESQRPGARDADGLLQAIEQYLHGSLAADAFYDVLWAYHVSGAMLYDAGIAAYREYVDNYQPRISPQWPILAILQNEDDMEAKWLIDADGLYLAKIEDLMLGSASMHRHLESVFEPHAGGMGGWLIERRGLIQKRMQELEAFRRGLAAASSVLGIRLLDSIILDTDRSQDSLSRLNALITIARSMGPIAIDEPRLPIEPIDLDNIQPDKAVVDMISERMPLLPKGWASMPVDTEQAEPAAEEASYEPT